MKDVLALLARIGTGLERGLIDQRVAAHYLGAHLCRRLYCSRAALWTIRDAPAGATLMRVGGFDALADRPLGDVATLDIAAPSAWIDELRRGGGYVSNDVAADPRLVALRSSCVAPAGTGALLQATIGSDARVCGFISCEQAGPARAWTPDDERLLRQVTAAVAEQRARRLATPRA